MRELALFAGGGGGLLGSILLGHKIVGAVEIEPYCREIIMRRQRDGLLPVFPLWDDVRTFDGEPWRGKVDLITAGFPCQPFSVAGKRKGGGDERNMWPDTIRIIRQVGPRFALLENVPGLLAHPYFGTILGDLAESGYHARWTCLGADDIGANHRRKRLWILADASSQEFSEQRRKENKRGWLGQSRENLAYSEGGIRQRKTSRKTGYPAFGGEDVADPNSEHGERRSKSRQPDSEGRTSRIEFKGSCSDVPYPTSFGTGRQSEKREQDWKPTSRGRLANGDWWLSEPAVGRVAHGVARRVDRLKAIGNGQVPGVVQAVWKLMKNLE